MNEFGVVQIIALLAWLVLAGSAFAAFRLGWKESVRMALTWAGIFVAVMALAIPLIWYGERIRHTTALWRVIL